MQEILGSLSAGARVLDLGCQYGSFPAHYTQATVIRLDRDAPAAPGARFVQGDAARLPFATDSFDAVIANHSLEHFDQLDDVLREIGRIVRGGGALFVAVPDADTLTDRLYRWIGKGGGHVNPFTDAAELARRIESATGLARGLAAHAVLWALFSQSAARSATAAAASVAAGRGQRAFAVRLRVALPAAGSLAGYAHRGLRVGADVRRAPRLRPMRWGGRMCASAAGVARRRANSGPTGASWRRCIAVQSAER